VKLRRARRRPFLNAKPIWVSCSTKTDPTVPAAITTIFEQAVVSLSMSEFRNRLYYGVKPLIPAAARHVIRKWFVRRQRKQVGNIWPILPGSERPPDGWAGWPHGKKFAFVLTHDVESQTGVDKCRQLMELEMKWGFRSSTNFIPEGDYRMTRELREELTNNGFEVGVHDLHHDGRLYQNRRHFATKAIQINQHLKYWGAVGFRSGFMLHNLEWLHDLDIQYDASTFDTDPFEPQPDNVGTIFPLWVPGPAGRGYLELPYTLPQDSTLFLLLGEASPDIWFQKLDWIAQKGGMALINVHSDYLRFAGEPVSSRTYPAAFYESLLQRVAERYAGAYWNVLPKDLAAWYRKTNELPADTAGRSRAATIPRPAPVLPAKRPLEPMRAAVLLYADYPSDARPRNEAEALARSGMEVDVICLREDPGSSFHDKIDGVNLFQIPLRRRRSSKLVYILQYAWFLAASFLLLSTLALRRRYRLVHVHNMPDFLVFSAVVPRLRGAKVILDLHDPMPELCRSIYGLSEDHWLLRWLKRIEKHSIAFADLVLTPNKAFRDLFIARGCRPEKIDIVMNAPSQTMFHGETCASRFRISGEQSFTLMYHGLLVERHGLDLAVRAMAKVLDRVPHIKLHIYGQPTAYMDGVMNLVRDLGLQDAVQYKGFKSLPEIAEALTTIDLGLIPNRLDSFTRINLPTRIFECLAMNKPVLVPRTQGVRDYFTDEDILFFEPGDIDDLAEKIEWAAQNPVLLQQIMERGREVYKKHRWGLKEEHFNQLVQNLLERKIAAPSLVQHGRSRRICMVAFSNYENDNRVMRYAEELAKRGDHVEVLTLKREKNQPILETINGVHVCRVQRRSRKDQQNRISYLFPLIQFFLSSSIRLSWRHFKKPYDLIHVHNMPDFLVFTAWLPKLAGCKVILDIHDIVPEFYASKFDIGFNSRGVAMLKNVERASARFSNHVIVSNHLWLDTFAARNAAKDKCSVFINNVNPGIFRPRTQRRDDGKFIILFPGGLQWHQGLDIALNAFKKVAPQAPNAEFHIYGDGNMKQSLIDLTHKLGLDDKVRFFAPLSVRQIAEVMANADLGVVPKRADSFGDKAYSTKIMEFMAVGVPVIVSSTTIDRYYFNDSVVRFFPSGDADALAAAMLEMMGDRDLRGQMAARASEYAQQNSWETRKGDYLELIDSLCASKGRNGHETHS
jgi:glycosyltransferase involved in cell wall biosynthesis